MDGALTDRWLVIFCDPDPLEAGAKWRDRLTYWLLSWLKPGYRHCYLMRPGKAFKGWLVADVKGDRSSIIEVPANMSVDVGGITFASYTEYVDTAVANGLATILCVAEQPVHACVYRGHFNCVTSVKHLLGINGRALTPWQLHRYLMREGLAESPK